MKKIVFVFVVVGLLLGMLFFLGKKETLEKYYNTSINEEEKVKNIIQHLEIKKDVQSVLINDKILNISLKEDTSLLNLYQKLEKQSLFLFSLIKDLEEVQFVKESTLYSFTYSHSATFFTDSLRNLPLEKIENRYKQDYFQKENIYMGNVKGYDLFDESDRCSTNLTFLFEEDGISYYLECSDINALYAYKENEKIPFQDLYPLSIQDVKETDLKLKNSSAND